MSSNYKFMNIIFLMFFLKYKSFWIKITFYISCIYIFSKKMKLFLQEKKGYFCQDKTKNLMDGQISKIEFSRGLLILIVPNSCVRTLNVPKGKS